MPESSHRRARRVNRVTGMDPSLSDSLRRVEALMATLVGTTSGRHDLSAVSVAELRKMAEDRSAPSSDRRAALSNLADRLAGEKEFADLVLTLIDDPDEDLARDAIGHAPPFDAR